jgi:hypothetical protein
MSDKNSLNGKPWKVVSSHSTYESADKERTSLSEEDNLQVKVKRYASGTFTVRTRSLVVEEVKKKKSTKSKGKPMSKSEKRKLRDKKKNHKR